MHRALTAALVAAALILAPTASAIADENPDPTPTVEPAPDPTPAPPADPEPVPTADPTPPADPTPAPPRPKVKKWTVDKLPELNCDGTDPDFPLGAWVQVTENWWAYPDDTIDPATNTWPIVTEISSSIDVWWTAEPGECPDLPLAPIPDEPDVTYNDDDEPVEEDIEGVTEDPIEWKIGMNPDHTDTKETPTDA